MFLFAPGKLKKINQLIYNWYTNKYRRLFWKKALSGAAGALYFF